MFALEVVDITVDLPNLGRIHIRLRENTAIHLSHDEEIFEVTLDHELLEILNRSILD